MNSDSSTGSTDNRVNNSAPIIVPNELPSAELNSPDKKKPSKGKITAIIIGSLAIFGIIAGILLYFFWWSNPNKVMADAVKNILTADNITISGETTLISNEELDLKISINGARKGDKSKGALSINYKMIPEMNPIKLDIDLLYTKDAIYFKAEGLKKTTEIAINSLLEQSINSSFPTPGTGELDSTQQQTIISLIKTELERKINPLVSKIDGQWVEISMNYLKEMATENQCMIDVINNHLTNKETAKEVAKIYAKNSWLPFSDEKIDTKNGARGFVIDFSKLDITKVNNFTTNLLETKFIKDAEECAGEKVDRDGTKITKSDTKNLADLKIKIWVNNFDHKLTSFSVETNSGRTTSKMSYDFTYGKVKDSEIAKPSNSIPIKDFAENLAQLIQQFSGGDQEIAN